uniref:Pept_C1 domain-containing protein n=1 Tax=Rhabditophanes sp. KR3021 TaxID=114890 RepID=A0AC35U9X4_9BILA
MKSAGIDGELPRSRNRNQADGDNKSNKYLYIFIGLILLLTFACVLGVGGLYYRYLLLKKETLSKDTYMKHLISQVNQGKDVRWKAKFNPFGEKVTKYNHKMLRNSTAIKEHVALLDKFFKSDRMKDHLEMLETFDQKSLPLDFDSRIKWPNCPTIGNVVNQGECGACFSVSSSAVASDRSCIASNGSFVSLLSAEDILGCCPVCGSCYGGDPLKALVYWATEGVVTGGRDGCRPYNMQISCGTPCSPASYDEGEYKRACIKSCQNIYYQNEYDEDKHMGSIAYTIFPRSMTIDQNGKQRAIIPSVVGHFNKSSPTPLSSEEIRTIIKKELFLAGPTTMAFPVTEEFLHYHSGVFHPYPEENYSKRIIYWHVVKLIGWGTDEEGRLHWICVNSFGSQWGDNGIFKIDTSLLEHYGLEYETGLL